jgi:hypothetical protein
MAYSGALSSAGVLSRIAGRAPPRAFDVGRRSGQRLTMRRGLLLQRSTDLPSNFAEVARCPFSVGAAVSHLRRLGSDTQKRAAEYFAKAPLFIETPLRKALQD